MSMERRIRGKTKDMEAEQGGHPVLADIGNLEVSRTTEGKLISRPIARKLHAKLLANEQTENLVHVFLEVQANEQGAAHGEKNVIVHLEHGAEDLTHKPNVKPVEMLNFESGERANFVCERESRKKPRRNVKTQTSEITAPSKEASGVLIRGEDQRVDIDANDPNELAVAEYLDDLYKFFKLTELEDKNRPSDYMKSQHEINEMMRSITVDWHIETHMIFSLRPETLFLTVNIIDRYLSSTNVPKKELQLLGISSMLLACKYEEISTPQVRDFITITDNAYTRNQILSMEREILQRLEWNLSVPTPYVFLVRFIRAFGLSDKQMENMAFFIAELGLLHYKTTVTHLPSITAAAAVYAARYTLSKRPLSNEISKHMTGYTTQQLRDYAKVLIMLHSNIQPSNLKATYQKYSTLERGSVAFLIPPDDKGKQL